MGQPPFTPPGKFLLLICWKLSQPRAILRLGRLYQLKNPMTLSGIEPATFQHVPFKCAANMGLLNILLPVGYHIRTTTDYTGKTICT
jgi:hypothetical protein